MSKYVYFSNLFLSTGQTLPQCGLCYTNMLNFTFAFLISIFVSEEFITVYYIIYFEEFYILFPFPLTGMLAPCGEIFLAPERVAGTS